MCKRITSVVTLVAAILLPTAVAAQSPTPAPPSGGADARQVPEEVKHFPYKRPSGAPLIQNIFACFPELKPGQVLSKDQVLQLWNGTSKCGPDTVRLMDEGLAATLNGPDWKIGQRAHPRIVEQVKAGIPGATIRDILGKDCHVRPAKGPGGKVIVNNKGKVVEEYYGTCDDDTMNQSESFRMMNGHAGKTEFAPVQIEFDSKVLVIEGIEFPAGTHFAGQEATVFITVWFSKWFDPNPLVRKEVDPAPCVNFSSHIHAKPAPPSPPVDEVETQDEAVAAPIPVPLPVVVPQTPQVTKTDVQWLKVSTDKKGKALNAPKNIKDIEVVDGNGRRGEILGQTMVTWTNPDGKIVQAQALQGVFLNVPVPVTGSTTFLIEEKKSIKGWTPKVQRVSLVIPSTGDWQALLAADSVRNFGLDRPVLVNEKKGGICSGKKKLACIGIPIAAAVGTYFALRDHETPKQPEPKPQPGPQKVGGPGGSPASLAPFAFKF